MPVAEYGSGSITVTVGTEHFLNTPDPSSDDGVYQFVVDVSGMQTGDELEVRVYEAALSTDTASQQVAVWTVLAPWGDGLFVSPAMILLHRWRFSIKQTTGTARTYKWSIRRIT